MWLCVTPGVLPALWRLDLEAVRVEHQSVQELSCTAHRYTV